MEKVTAINIVEDQKKRERYAIAAQRCLLLIRVEARRASE